MLQNRVAFLISRQLHVTSHGMAFQEKTVEAIPLCGRVLALSPRGVLGLGSWSLGVLGVVEMWSLVGPV